MRVKLYDGWNYYRVVAETDQTSLAPRRLYDEMFEPGVLHIWCWDGQGARKRRQAIFPQYKANRKPPAEDIYASIMLFRDVLKHSPAFQVELPGIEADDVIATLVDHYQGAQIEIYSNDYDLAALCRPGVICGARPKAGVSPDQIHVYKTFKGDPSDNIPGVKGFGDKAWEAADKAILEAIAEACVAGIEVDRFLPKMFRDEIRGEAAIRTWIKANTDQVAAMWAITGFMPVTPGQVADALYRPIVNREAAEQLFRKFLL